MKQSFPDDTAPAAIAFSGGGDSTAMLHAFRDDPSVSHAFIVDHALRTESAEEALQAASIAKAYGYKVQIDKWAHDGITTGIQAKAREYRYAALGRMCRAAGVKRLMTAHTEDDLAETLLMRMNRKTGWRGLAGIIEYAYAPIWPQLAGVSLHRPWLGKSREALREYNRKHALSFIDDPSNSDRKFARIRARETLAANSDLRASLLEQQIGLRERLAQERQEHAIWLREYARLDPQGYIETRAVPPSELLLHLLNAASGQGGPIDSTKRERLCRDMSAPDFKAATLGGGWVIRKPRLRAQGECHSFVFLRDRVAVSGRSDISRLHPLKLEPHVDAFWDGRFFCRAKRKGISIEPGLGHLQKLRQLPEFKTFFDIPKDIRESLPIFFLGEKPINFGACDTEYVTSSATSASRLQALFKELETVPI